MYLLQAKDTIVTARRNCICDAVDSSLGVVDGDSQRRSHRVTVPRERGNESTNKGTKIYDIIQ